MNPKSQAPALPDTHYLDNRIFTEEAIYRREQSEIFQKVWLLVCHESEIAKPGDFRATSAAGKPILVVRTPEGVIRSFYNVCRHRAAPVVREESGCTNEFQCFYHQWTYGLNGALTGISKPEGYKRVRLDKAKLGLIPVKTDIYAGFVFVCLDDSVAPLADYVADIFAPMLAPLGTVPLEVFHFHKMVIQSNWKLWQDNNSERYHSYLHAINRKTLPWVTGKSSPMKLRMLAHGHSGYWSDGEATARYDIGGYTGLVDEALPGLQQNEMRVINLFPDVMINIRSNVVRVDRMVPLGPGRTLVEWRGLGVKGDSAEMRAVRLRHHNLFWGPAGRNLAEDVIAVEAQWKCMEADVVRYSILAREEDMNPTDDENVRAFYQEWGRRLGLRANAPLDGPGREAIRASAG